MMPGRALTLPDPLAVALLGACALTALSCGSGGSSPGPTTPPVAATPTPTPAPPPAPPVESGANSCHLGPGTLDTGCTAHLGSIHLADVQGAIDRVVQTRPELFDLGDQSGEGLEQYRVLDADDYFDAIVAELTATGLCAGRSLDRETLQVKGSNELSEDFDILLSSSHIRRNAYLTSCRPAAFPVGPAEVIARVRVGLWAFDCNPGVVPPHPTARKLPVGCDGSVTASPKDRDDADVPLSIHGPDVTWELRRGDEVIEVLPDERFPNPFNLVLRPRGPIDAFQLCATVQGHEGCLNGDTIR